MLNVGILGASGFTGVELLRLCAAHPRFNVTYATGDTQAGTLARSLYPSLAANYPNLVFEEFILEKEGDTYDYGCAMLYFDFPQINKIHDAIDPKDLYEEEGDRTFGIEDEPHCTLLYGLHKEVTPEMIQEMSVILLSTALMFVNIFINIIKTFSK